jgi:hypothetical protein
MTPKIIELIIQDGDEEAGLDGIALVEMPAHEAEFQYFNDDTKSPCESGNCSHYVLSDEHIPKVIQMFHAFGEPQGFLEKEGWEITSVRPVGKQEFQIIANPNQPSAQDTPNVRFRYKYVGPKDDKNRTFCAEMMAARRVFRIEDIMEMSNLSVNEIGPDGYDIFTWRGSYNCRHRWVQLVYEPQGRIINNDKVDTGVVDEDGMPGPDTRTTSTIEAGNTPPRTGFAASNPDVSALSPYVDQITKPKKKPVLNSLPLFEKKEDAETFALAIGCEGSHEHDINGKIMHMPCKVHPKEDTSYEIEGDDDDDENDNPMMNYGSILEDFAEVGERGGIKESKKAPKSSTPNPNPKGEGTAKGDASGKRGAVVSERVENILEEKVKEFNERYKDKLDYGVDKGMLKSVYQRGVGAYNVSHSPKVQSSEQWALARVNAFLYMVKEGRPQNKKYTGDNDLLPKKHPKYEQASAEEFASFDDYPELIRQNAQAVLDYIDRTGNPKGCMTQVGKIRAQQLAQGKPISIDTVKRMKAYITRHEKDLDASKSYDDGCGKLAMDAWGGIEALPWVERTIAKYENMSKESEMTFSVFNSEERLVVGPSMIPDKMIIRRNEITGEIYYVYFTAETIKKLQQKYMQEKLLDKTNVEHGRRFLNGVTVVESWIVEDPERDKQQVFGMNYPKGTWMIMMKVEEDSVWQKVKDGKLNGFSVQGYFLEKAKFGSDNQKLIEQIKDILNEVR